MRIRASTCLCVCVQAQCFYENFYFEYNLLYASSYVSLYYVHCPSYYQRAGVKSTESSKLTRKQLNKLAFRLTKAYGLNIGNNFRDTYKSPVMEMSNVFNGDLYLLLFTFLKVITADSFYGAIYALRKILINDIFFVACIIYATRQY